MINECRELKPPSEVLSAFMNKKQIIMKTTKEFYNYLEEHTTSEMHIESKHYLSQLYFIRDEQHFFEELFEEYSFQLIVTENFSENRAVIDNWSKLLEKNEEYIQNLLEHDKKIELLINTEQTVTEIKYILWHKNLIKDVRKHIVNYKEIKQSIFDIIKAIKRKQKKEQKQLLDK